MNHNQLLREISYCQNCFECLEVCDTYKVTDNFQQSPNGRLIIAKKTFKNEKITAEELNSMYTCTLCSACNVACQKNIDISKIIHASKLELVADGKGPLEVHKKIIKGILENDNSVGGKPEERLNWLPESYLQEEIFDERESDTLLFLGCMSSFRVKESAAAPYLILKKTGFEFKILKNEPCCGEYAYSAGNLDVAKRIFQDNMDLFKKQGIKNIVVTCGGCLYAFNTVYRKYFEDFDLNVRHVIDVIHELSNQKELGFKKLNKAVTYHDPCRLGRKYDKKSLYNEPRELLEKCGVSIKEITQDHENCPCCGAGSGIRGVDSNICIKIGKNLFDSIEPTEIASSCPLCVFNFRYVNYKNQANKESKYITDYILESIK